MTDITFIPIQNSPPSYVSNINIFGRDLKITFTWNTRKSDRSILIEDVEDGVLLENTFLELESPVDLNTNARLLGYNYQLFLSRKSMKFPKKKLNMINWSDNYILTMLSKDEITFTPNPKIKPSKPKTPIGKLVINVEFLDGDSIIDSSNVVVSGYVTNIDSGSEIELTITGTGGSPVTTTCFVQEDMTFTTTGLDLSSFLPDSLISVTATKLNNNVGGFISNTDTAMLPDVVSQPKLPVILDENYVFNDEGESTDGWTATNSTLSVNGSWLRMTKNTTSQVNAIMSKPVTLTGTDKDFIIFGKVRAKTGGATDGGVIWLYDGGVKTFGLWLNYKATPTTAIEQGTISIEGHTTSPQTAVIATSVDIQNAGVEFALQYDHKFSALNCYFRQPDNTWVLMGRVATNWFSVPTIDLWSLSNAPNGWWVEFDYLMVSKPNIVVIGDSIAEGKTLYSPNLSLNLSNYQSTWARYFGAYTNLRNNLVVNKGVGAEASSTTLSRITDATSIGARVVFLHASSNDYVQGVSNTDRTTNITNTITAIESSGAQAVLLNAMYGTNGMVGNPQHRDYMQNWWINHSGNVGAYSTLDIMQPILDSGFMNPVYTQPDQIHPNVIGYSEIGSWLKVQ